MKFIPLAMIMAYKLNPIHARYATNTFLVVTQQATNDFPLSGTTDFHVTLFIDANDGFRSDSGCDEIIGMDFIVVDYLGQSFSGEFYKFHRFLVLQLLGLTKAFAEFEDDWCSQLFSAYLTSQIDAFQNVINLLFGEFVFENTDQYTS